MSPDEPGVTVPDDPPDHVRRRDPFLAVVLGVILLGGLIFVLAVAWTGDRMSDELAVRRRMADLVVEASQADGAGFRAYFDFARLLRESVRAGVLSEGEEASRLEDVASGMARLCERGAGTDRQWKDLRISNVSIRSGGEAEAFARIRTEAGWFRYRFFLVRRESVWRVFDWESMDEALRISTFVPSLLSPGTAEDPSTAGARAVVSGIRGTMLLGAAGEYEKALDALKQLRVMPDARSYRAAIHRLEAEYHFALGRFAEALRSAELGLEEEDPSPMLILFRAEALSNLERYEESLDAARDFRNRLGEDSEARHLAGVALEGLEKPEAAELQYRDGVAAEPEDFRNRFSLGILLLRKGKSREAADALIAACRYAPPSLDYFESAAPELASAKQYALLLELAEDQHGRTPADTRVAFYRGFALRRLGRLEEAERALRQGLEERDQGDRIGLRSELALALAQREKPTEAHEIMEAVRREDAVWGDYLHACLEARAGHAADALRALRFVLRADPSYHRDADWEPILEPLIRQEEVRGLLREAKDRAAYRDRVDSALEGEDWEELLSASRARAKAADEDADAFYYQGVAFRRLERFAEAKEAFEAGAERVGERDRPAYWRELAFVLAHLGRAAEAHAQADRLIATARMEPVGYHARAYVFAREGKEDEAARALRTLLKDHPSWRTLVESEPLFAEIRRRPEIRDLLR